MRYLTKHPPLKFVNFEDDDDFSWIFGTSQGSFISSFFGGKNFWRENFPPAVSPTSALQVLHEKLGKAGALEVIRSHRETHITKAPKRNEVS